MNMPRAMTASAILALVLLFGVAKLAIYHLSPPKVQVSAPNVPNNEFTIVTPYSHTGVHCKACSYSSCGVICKDCDSGLEYYCMPDFSGKNEVK